MSIQTINENDYIKDSREIINSNFSELDTNKAPLNSPAFTGTPTAPTQTKTDNSTNLATTEYVKAVVADYLALTGGTMTGNISFNKTEPLIKGDLTTGKVGVYSGGNNYDGATLQLFGRSDSSNGGKFFLRASTKSSSGSSGTSVDLVGNPTGALTWGGKNVERVNASGSNYIRFESGLQICYEHILNVSSTWKTVNFPAAFSVGPIMGLAPKSRVIFAVANVDTQNFTIRSNNETAYDVDYIAIGRWK